MEQQNNTGGIETNSTNLYDRIAYSAGSQRKADILIGSVVAGIVLLIIVIVAVKRNNK